MKIPFRSVHIKYEFGVPWLKIFYHNSTNCAFFTKESEIQYIDTAEKFSLLGRITNEFKLEGSYEFLLQYPEVKGYNRWKQTSYILETTGSTTGYEANQEDISWSMSYWKGLARTTTTSETFIDGSFNSGWYWYSLGAKGGYSSKNRFPGPSTSYGNGPSVLEVYLWIRVNNDLVASLISKSKKQFLRKSVKLVLIRQLMIIICSER